MSDCRSDEYVPIAPPFPASRVGCVAAPAKRFYGPSRSAVPPRNRGNVPVVFATLLIYLGVTCLAVAAVDARPDWYRALRPSFRRGTASVMLSASMSSPRRETTTPVRVVPPSPAPRVPAEPVHRRRAHEPALPEAAFAAAERGTRVPLPQLNANRAASETLPSAPLESAVPPPRQATEHMPRETAVAFESIASVAAAASSGVNTLEPPTRLQRIEPPYPQESLARGEHGLVKLRVRIDASGRVIHAEVAQSSGYSLLDNSALRTAFRWRYPTTAEAAPRHALEFVEKVRFRHPLVRE